MDEYALRRETLRASLREDEAVAVTPGGSFQYLTGATPIPGERPCWYLASPRGDVILVNEIDAASLGRIGTQVPLERYGDAEGAASALGRARAHLGAVKSLAVEDAMRADALLMLQEVLVPRGITLLSAQLGSMRTVKSASEIDRLRLAAAQADAGIEAAMNSLAPGVTEFEVATAAHAACLAAGAQWSSSVQVVFGERTAWPRERPGARALAAGEVVMVDVDARHDGYVAGVTRMAVVGRAPDGFEAVHGIVEAAMVGALRAARPGARAAEVDAAARGVVAEGGYGERFVHRLGHGRGLDAHEPPWLDGQSTTALRPGMVVTVEPGVYLPGEFGVRLAETLVVTPAGAEPLSRLGRAPRRVDA